MMSEKNIFLRDNRVNHLSLMVLLYQVKQTVHMPHFILAAS